MNLVCEKNVMIDMSIYSAYVKVIRAAHKFIYIENQYFLGLSYNWDLYKDLGVPSSTATQRILFCQFKTMQMMYKTIYRALVEAGLENEYEPQDYLNFFCLGNRELSDNENTSKTVKLTGQNTPQVLAQKNRRFMIDVHSKGMIVDDECVNGISQHKSEIHGRH
ncbi:phospholipase D gamma [Trifolium repens]|nr:phospholipase D gamma [Trifolium repens]